MFSGKILFLVISTLFLQCKSQIREERKIRGLPEVDFPTYYVIPKTSFRCSDQLYNPGFYADTETRCQVFHYCYEHRQESFLCPMGTIFNQPILTCDYWYSANCSLAPSYYHVNADKREEVHFDEANDPLTSQSENLFDKMAHLYETDNKAPESFDLKNDFDVPEIKLLDRDGVESSGEPLIEKSNKAENYNKYNYGNHFNMVDEVSPEVVKYEVGGLDILNTPKGIENEQFFETDDAQDFIFAEDGMLHPRQEDIYQIYPTDMNFNQEYSGFAEIPSEGNFNYDLNGDFDSESDLQLLDFVLQKRYADANSDYVKRIPSSRKPVIVIPEEPEIEQQPVVKQRRRHFGMGITASTNANTGYLQNTNYDSNIYKEDTASIANEVRESTKSEEFPTEEPNSGVSHNDLRDPKLFYETQEEIDGGNGSQLHPTDSLSIAYGYSNKKTRKAYVLSNTDDGDETLSVFESGSNDVPSVSNVEHRSILTDSNQDDKSEVYIGNVTVFTALAAKSLEATAQDESSIDSDPFLGSGSEEINQSHWSDRSNIAEDQDIFSDGEDTEITDTETSYVLPMNLSDAFEGSGISALETADMPNFTEEINEPVEFVLKDSESSIKYGKESSFPSETFGDFSPLENSEDNDEAELVSNRDGSNELSLPHESQESFDNPEDASDKTVPEIREIDGNYYYVFSDSEYHSNFENDVSSGFYSKDVDYAVAENFEDASEKTTEELIDNEGFRYVSTDSKLKMDNVEDGSPSFQDYRDSINLEDTYEKLSGEFEAGTSSDIPEEYAVDDSDRTRQLSTEDLKFWEFISQSPSPTLKNLFEVSKEKSNFDIKEEMPRIEIVSPKPDITELATTHEEPVNVEDLYEFESLASDTFSVGKEHPVDGETPKNNSDKNAEDVLNKDYSDQDGPEIPSPEQNQETFVSGKEADPFGPLISESKMLLDDPLSKQTSSLKVPPVQPKNVVASPVMRKDLKKTARGKRFNENLRTFNPLNAGGAVMIPSQTFREAMFTSIPSAFLKMKHSTLRPYFYNYGLKNSGFNPRTGDVYQPSKLSKLASLGKRLLAAKSAKLNRMKKYIDSYRD